MRSALQSVTGLRPPEAECPDAPVRRSHSGTWTRGDHPAGVVESKRRDKDICA